MFDRTKNIVVRATKSNLIAACFLFLAIASTALAGAYGEDADKVGETPAKGLNIVEIRLKADERFTKIEVYHGGGEHKVVQAIRFFAKKKDGTGEEFELGLMGRLPREGGPQVYTFKDKEVLKGVEYNKGTWVDWLRWVTSEGKAEQMGGDSTPVDKDHEHGEPTAADGKKVVGLRFWSQDADVKGIQLIVAPLD